MPSPAFTEREMRMLLSIVELEGKNARLTFEKWRDTPSDGYADGPAALQTERDFSRGFELGVWSIVDTVRSVLNG